jgi:hypothetical protein
MVNQESFAGSLGFQPPSRGFGQKTVQQVVDGNEAADAAFVLGIKITGRILAVNR